MVTILVVEDVAEDAQPLIERFLQNDWTVRCANDLVTAKRLASIEQITIAFVDLMLPPHYKDEGIEFAEWLSRRVPKCPIVLITRRPDVSTPRISQIISLGTAGILSKD